MDKSITDQVEQNVLNLLNSDITGYKIYMDTGVNQSFISRLRNDVYKIENTNWGVVKKLSDYAEKELKDD